MSLSLCSFGRDSLSAISCSSPSWRRVLRAFLAARRRWPGGRLRVSLSILAWEEPDCCVGLMLSGWWRSGRVVDALTFSRVPGAVYLAWLLFPSVRPGWRL
jgi:hypothetical protein